MDSDNLRVISGVDEKNVWVRIKMIKKTTEDNFLIYEQIDKKNMINIFESKPSAYPGFISRQIADSDEEISPFIRRQILNDKKKLDLLVFYADKNFNYVVKDKSKTFYRCILFWLYHKEVGFSIRIFVPSVFDLDKELAELGIN